LFEALVDNIFGKFLLDAFFSLMNNATNVSYKLYNHCWAARISRIQIFTSGGVLNGNCLTKQSSGWLTATADFRSYLKK